jgi:cation diffusion facilitator CzcD-associated flavoprotein CzcO
VSTEHGSTRPATDGTPADGAAADGTPAERPVAGTAPGAALRLRTEIVVVGAGQAGLSTAYHLQRRGLAPVRGYVVLDRSPAPGGAWQFRWPSLTLGTVNRLHDLPGLRLADVVDARATDVQAADAVPRYFAAYERTFALPVYRPVTVTVVCDRGERLVLETDRGEVSARGIINATGTWESPYVPEIAGAGASADASSTRRTTAPRRSSPGGTSWSSGAGISAIQLLDEVSRVTTTTWVTRRPPEFRAGPFDESAGRAAVRLVEERVRRGLPPASVVSVTGIPLTPAVEAMRARGVLEPRPMFDEITEDGVRWADGTTLRADVILWCTGFRSALDHLAPLALRGPDGGIVMTGRLATQVAGDTRVHLVGYGPSASTVGANRAGSAAAAELMATLGLG